jgi:selenocysteine lyase/cysteine desulfurase
VSLLRAFQFIESIGSYEAMIAHENDLMKYTLEKYKHLKNQVKLIGSEKIENRTGIFSFSVSGIHIADLVESFAEE